MDFRGWTEASVDLSRRATLFFALKDNQTEQIISEVSQATASWREVARNLGMSAADIAGFASALDKAGN